MDEQCNELATKALAFSELLERGLLEVAREHFGDSEPTMMKGIESAINLLKSVHETRWPASVISDTDKPGERIMRSVGLTLVNVPEIVMRFELDESDAAVGIFRDLVTTAVDNPEEARGKIFPGRRVCAFRFGRKYYMHCALTDPCGCDICTNDDDIDTSGVTTEGAPIWDALGPFVPDFRAVQIILIPPEPDAPAVNPPNGPRCSMCNEPLPEQQFRRCPCQAVAYCNRACQKKHWRVHKVMCARHASIQQQLRRGELKYNVRIN